MAIRWILADQVFLFKRTVRQAALKHDMYATFMAKPHADEPGSSMHLHQSVLDSRTGKNIFRWQGWKILERFSYNHIGGSATLPRRGACPCVRTQCELLSSSGAGLRCADKCALGHRQSHGAIARPVI